MAQRKRQPPAICSSVYEARVEARKGAEESERLDRREMARDTPVLIDRFTRARHSLDPETPSSSLSAESLVLGSEDQSHP